MKTESFNTPKIINIQIHGAWNTRIFRPDWLIKTLELEKNPLFQEKKGEIGIGVNFDERDFGFNFCGISIQPTRNTLTINIEDLSEFQSKLVFPVKVMKKIIDSLCHTPLKGIGFNFTYEFDKSTTCKIAQDLLKRDTYKNFSICSKRFIEKKENYTIYILSTIPVIDKKILGKLDFLFYYSPRDNKILQFKDDVFNVHLKFVEEALNA
jgi:hypothetical protein